MKSIAILVDNAPARIERVTKIADSLGKEGNDVIVIYPRPLDALDRYRRLGIPCIRRPAILQYVTFGMGVFIALLLLRRRIIHFVNHPDYLIPLLCIACKIGGHKLVYDRRVDFSEVVARSHPGSARIARLFEHLGYRCAKAIIIVVPSFAVRLTRYKEKVALVPNGVDLTMFRRVDAPHPKFTVICVAALTESEGVDVFVKAASKVRERDRSVEFKVVGDGELMASLTKLSHELGDPVEFLGWIPHRDVPALLASSDICVSSVMPLSYSEVAYPVKLFEYFAAGKPSIISNVVGHLELAKDGQDVVVYDAKDPDDLAAKILDLKGNPDLRKELSENGWLIAKRYSWDEAFHTLIGIYEQLS
jgi:glycosyltransferase involved in cell wall biosynthesis